MNYTVEKKTADVVVIGGGIAGCCAAIKAAENGSSVLVVERANTYRSGCAGSGIDHLWSYVPPVHEKVGYTRDMMKDDMETPLVKAGLADRNMARYFVDVSYERIIELEKYGLKMRYEDSHLADGFRLVPQFQSIPTSINFDGRDLKVKLTEQMLKEHVKVLNHAIVVRILKDKEGKAAGVIAVSSREDKIYIVQAKAVILSANAGAGRLNYKVNIDDRYYEDPSSVRDGSGISLPLNAGAEVANLEFTLSSGELAFHGFSTRVGSPGSSWWPCAEAVDDDGVVVVHRIHDFDIHEPDYVKKSAAEYAKFMEEFNSMHVLLSQGRQLYMDFSHATDEEINYILWTLGNEGRMWLYRQNLNRNHVRLQDIRVPYTYDPAVRINGQGSGIYTNWKGETTVPGLYAAGASRGLCAGGGAFAIVTGDEAGIQASSYVKGKNVSEISETDPEVRDIVEKAETIRNRKNGERWQDVERELRGIVTAFAPMPLTDTKVAYALQLIEKLKNNPDLSADNPHETARSFEVLSLIDTAEAIFSATQYRTESFRGYHRFHHYRDEKNYDPSKEPETTKVLTLKRENGKFVSKTHDLIQGEEFLDA